MIDVAPFESLGRFDNDWLNARYHFSFSGYHDPKRNGVGALLVWNDDVIAPGRGFGFHPHRDMEIVTYIRRGALSNRDSLGHDERIPAGTVQVMSAGTGIVHSEFNREAEPITVFQIWILPAEQGGAPTYHTVPLEAVADGPGFVALASGRKGVKAAPIRQDASVLRAVIPAGGKTSHKLEPGRHAYLVANSGDYAVNGVKVKARDGVHASDVASLEIVAETQAEIILVDVPS